jgi:hypothetical protein
VINYVIVQLGVGMATLYQQIADKFLAKLAESKDADEERIDQLRVLLADGKKVKSEDFVKIFSAPAGGDLK